MKDKLFKYLDLSEIESESDDDDDEFKSTTI